MWRFSRPYTYPVWGSRSGSEKQEKYRALRRHHSDIVRRPHSQKRRGGEYEARTPRFPSGNDLSISPLLLLLLGPLAVVMVGGDREGGDASLFLFFFLLLLPPPLTLMEWRRRRSRRGGPSSSSSLGGCLVGGREKRIQIGEARRGLSFPPSSIRLCAPKSAPRFPPRRHSYGTKSQLNSFKGLLPNYVGQST